MRCPHCGSVVEPLRDTSGALFCPACQNSGTVMPAWPPRPRSPSEGAEPRGAGARGPSPVPGKAVAALVLGICAVFLSPLGLLLGPLAIVMAVKARTELKGLPAGTGGRGLATAGLALGSVGILASLAIVGVMVVSFLTRDAPPVSMEFDVDAAGDGGVLRLASVTGTTPFSSWSDYQLGGTARCTLPSGDIDPGDEIVCVTDGDVVVGDWADGRVLFTTTV